MLKSSSCLLGFCLAMGLVPSPSLAQNLSLSMGGADEYLASLPAEIDGHKRVVMGVARFAQESALSIQVGYSLTTYYSCVAPGIVGKVTQRGDSKGPYWADHEGTAVATVACFPPLDPKPQITLRALSETKIPYNSQRPLVIYVPKGIPELSATYRVPELGLFYSSNPSVVATCRPYTDTCRAAFCQGGVELSQDGRTLAVYRHYDYNFGVPRLTSSRVEESRAFQACTEEAKKINSTRYM